MSIREGPQVPGFVCLCEYASFQSGGSQRGPRCQPWDKSLQNLRMLQYLMSVYLRPRIKQTPLQLSTRFWEPGKVLTRDPQSDSTQTGLLGTHDKFPSTVHTLPRSMPAHTLLSHSHRTSELEGALVSPRPCASLHIQGN